MWLGGQGKQEETEREIIGCVDHIMLVFELDPPEERAG